MAVKIDSAVYHSGTPASAGATQFATDTLPTPAWANPVFSSDFKYVAGDAGLYAYTASSKTYARIVDTTFYTNKKVWSTSSAIVVFSWADGTPSTTKNFKVIAYAITAGTPITYNEVGKIEGTSHSAEPTVVFS